MTKENSKNIRHIFSGDPEILHERVQEYYQNRLKDKWRNRHPLKGRSPGPNSVLLRSNDYLSIAGDKRIIKAEIRALRKMGHGDAVSRTWLHHEQDPLHKFEKRIARLMRAESAVLCSSGYAANVGLIQSMTKPGDPVYLDMKAHISLWEGVIAAKAVPHAIRHNDSNHLERTVKKHGPGFVVVDSLYSIDGNLCPIEDFVTVAEKYDCPVIVDETHSFGAHGPNGAGIVVEKGLEKRVHFRTIGLSKAVASRGGVVICSDRNAEFFRYTALPAIFSTSVLQHEVAGYDAVLDILQTDHWRPKRLHKNHAYLVSELTKLGYNVSDSKSQIIALEAGDIIQTVLLRDALETRDVFGSIFMPPATPEKRCLIRFSVNCGLSDKELEHVINVCRDIRDEVKLTEWKSTKRIQKSIEAQKPFQIRNHAA